MAKKINQNLFRLFDISDKATDARMTEYEKSLLDLYGKAQKNIDRTISNMYKKFGDSVTYEDMVAFNRLKNMRQAIAEEIYKLEQPSKRNIKGAITDIYQENYYHTAFSLETVAQVNLGFTILSTEAINAAIINPLSKVKWPESLKTNLDAIVTKVNGQITQGLIEGKGYAVTAKEVQGTMGNAFFEAKRIVWTEAHRAQSAGRIDAIDKSMPTFEDMGAEPKKKWMATLDTRTRHNHGFMDGKVADSEGLFDFTTAKGSKIKVEGPGLTNTTDDIHCRCTLYIEFTGFELETRLDNMDKKVIPYQDYNDWAKAKGIKTKLAA